MGPELGMTHAGKIVTVIPENNTFRLAGNGRPSVWCPAPPVTK